MRGHFWPLASFGFSAATSRLFRQPHYDYYYFYWPTSTGWLAGVICILFASVRPVLVYEQFISDGDGDDDDVEKNAAAAGR